MYADSEEEEQEEQEGQSSPSGNGVLGDSGNMVLQPTVSRGDSQVSRLVGGDTDMVSVGGPPTAPTEEQDLPPPDPLECLPPELRDPPPGEPIPGISVSSAHISAWNRPCNGNLTTGCTTPC